MFKSGGVETFTNFLNGVITMKSLLKAKNQRKVKTVRHIFSGETETNLLEWFPIFYYNQGYHLNIKQVGI